MGDDHPDEHNPAGGHGHDHDPDHLPDHNHAQDHEPMERGEGRGKLLFLDAPSGLSGDMIISSLVDLGVPETVVAEAVASVHLTGFHLHFGTRVRSGIVATSFDVHVDEAQPERTYATIRAMLDQANLPDGVKAPAQ